MDLQILFRVLAFGIYIFFGMMFVTCFNSSFYSFLTCLVVSVWSQCLIDVVLSQIYLQLPVG